MEKSYQIDNDEKSYQTVYLASRKYFNYDYENRCGFGMNNRIRGKSIVKTATSPKTSGRMNQNGISSALTAAATALLTAALAARRALIASRKSSAIRLFSSTYEATVTGSVGCSIPTI